MSEFDSRARDWDKNAIHLERSEAIAGEIERNIPLSKKMNALEFGAGTGLLSFMLHEKLGNITMIDNSREMVKVANEKIEQAGYSNMSAHMINLEHENFAGNFDFIFTQMVFHHVENIEAINEKFYSLLNPGGFLAIADLFLEDGSFHTGEFNGHKGFDPEELGKKLAGAGFKNPRFSKCYTIKRTNEDGINKEYPIFLLVAEK